MGRMLMASETTGTRVDRDELLERGRRCVFGYLCPMVLHETNNVLTVMAGVRQLMRIGQSLPDRVGPMIDSQLEKMESLLNRIHWMGQEDGLEAAPPKTVEETQNNLLELVRLGTKGRVLNVTEGGSTTGSLDSRESEVVGLSFLCTFFGVLPEKSAAPRVNLHLEPALDGPSKTMRWRIDPFRGDPRSQPEILLALDIVQATGGEMTVSVEEQGGLSVSLQLSPPN